MKFEFKQSVQLNDAKGVKKQDFAKGKHEVPSEFQDGDVFKKYSKLGLIAEVSGAQAPQSLLERNKKIHEKMVEKKEVKEEVQEESKADESDKKHKKSK